MGAVPERDDRAAVSPLREFETRTESVTAISGKPGPRRFARVPTHTIGVASERRRYPRASLSLPLRLTRIGDAVQPIPVTLVTRNISSSGVFFLAPCEIDNGAGIEMEVGLIGRPLGMGSVQMRTAAHVVRVEDCETPGWRGYAATFDDIDFRRDDSLPPRFETA